MNRIIFGFKNVFYIEITVFCHVTPCSLVDTQRTTVTHPTKFPVLA